MTLGRARDMKHESRKVDCFVLFPPATVIYTVFNRSCRTFYRVGGQQCVCLLFVVNSNNKRVYSRCAIQRPTGTVSDLQSRGLEFASRSRLLCTESIPVLNVGRVHP